MVIAPTDYYHLLLSAKDKINDSFGYYFEHALLDTTKRCKFPYSPFFLKPCIEGMSGSTGEVYKSEPYSISFALRYAKYALSQKKRFNNLFLRN